MALLVQLGVGLCNRIMLFLIGREIDDLIAHHWHYWNLLQSQRDDLLSQLRRQLHSRLHHHITTLGIHYVLPQCLANEFLDDRFRCTDNFTVRGLYKAQRINPRMGRQAAN